VGDGRAWREGLGGRRVGWPARDSAAAVGGTGEQELWRRLGLGGSGSVEGPA